METTQHSNCTSQDKETEVTIVYLMKRARERKRERETQQERDSQPVLFFVLLIRTSSVTAPRHLQHHPLLPGTTASHISIHMSQHPLKRQLLNMYTNTHYQAGTPKVFSNVT